MGTAVQNLATVGAKIVIISNSSRRASTTMEKLKGLGFDPSFFSGAITSGELTHQSLQRSYHQHLLSLLFYIVGSKILELVGDLVKISIIFFFLNKFGGLYLYNFSQKF